MGRISTGGRMSTCSHRLTERASGSGRRAMLFTARIVTLSKEHSGMTTVGSASRPQTQIQQQQPPPAAVQQAIPATQLGAQPNTVAPVDADNTTAPQRKENGKASAGARAMSAASGASRAAALQAQFDKEAAAGSDVSPQQSQVPAAQEAQQDPKAELHARIRPRPRPRPPAGTSAQNPTGGNGFDDN